MTDLTVNFAVQTHKSAFVVPSELIKKNFKSIQKQIEKSKKQVTEEIAKIKKNPDLTAEQKLSSVRKLIKSFEQLKKRLSTSSAKDADFRSRITCRAERLNELMSYASRSGEVIQDNDDTEEADKVLDLHNANVMNWLREETNLLIADYLLKSNVQRSSNTGMKLLQGLEAESPLCWSKLVDHDVYTSYNSIFLSINEDHDLGPITAWYNENKVALKKISSNLQFEIYYCEYLSIIEKGDPLEAISFSKKHLSPYANRKNYGDSETDIYEKNLRRLISLGSPLAFISLSKEQGFPVSTLHSEANSSTVSALLSYSASSKFSKYTIYNKRVTEEHWSGLSRCFTEDFTRIFGISQTYPLLVYLSAGLSSLKTKSCFCNRQNTIFDADHGLDLSKTLDSSSLRDLALRGPNQYYKLLKKINQCPVCSPELYALSRNLPFASLITSIYNNPFKLPNGNIYPFDKLLNPEGKFEKDILVRNGKVRDPLTHEIFFIDDCVRVFPA